MAASTLPCDRSPLAVIGAGPSRTGRRPAQARPRRRLSLWGSPPPCPYFAPHHQCDTAIARNVSAAADGVATGVTKSDLGSLSVNCQETLIDVGIPCVNNRHTIVNAAAEMLTDEKAGSSQSTTCPNQRINPACRTGCEIPPRSPLYCVK